MSLKGRNKSLKTKKDFLPESRLQQKQNKNSLNLEVGRELLQVFGLHSGYVPGTPSYNLGAQL